MNVTRITIEWMTSVPVGEDGSHDFDRAKWACKEFPGSALKTARAFAQKTANKNAFGQTWLQIEHAPYEKAPEHLWERDYSADEIFEAAHAKYRT